MISYTNEHLKTELFAVSNVQSITERSNKTNNANTWPTGSQWRTSDSKWDNEANIEEKW
jgi:hypothetical protein